MSDLELETDALDEDELEELCKHQTCNGFAFWYKENVNGDAIVKDGMFNGSTEHCYIYDPELDATLDATLGQFDGMAFAGAWDGDEHPYVADHEEVYEWDSREAFQEHYGSQLNSPFIC